MTVSASADNAVVSFTSTGGGANAVTFSASHSVQDVYGISYSSASTSSVTNFLLAHDVVNLSVGHLATPESLAAATTAVTGGTAVTVQTQSSTANFTGSGNILSLTDTTYANAAAVLTAIKATGSDQLTFGGGTSLANGTSILVEYNVTGGGENIALITQSTTATTLNAASTAVDLVHLVGITNLTASNFAFVA